MELILVDTSVWVDHIRRPSPELVELIRSRRCLLHPYVLAEIALGNLPDWPARVARLRALPGVTPLPDDALLGLVEELGLQGSGVGFVDAHLLGSCRGRPETLIWSRDKRLASRAESLGIGWFPDGRN